MEEVKRTRALINATASEKLSANSAKALETLKTHNERLYEELKQIGNTIDNVISHAQSTKSRQDNPQIREQEFRTAQVQEDGYRKECEALRKQIQQSQGLSSSQLQQQNSEMQGKIREVQVKNRDLERLISEQSKQLEQIDSNPQEIQVFKRMAEELRVAKQKLQQTQEKYAQMKNSDDKIMRKYTEYEQQAIKLGINVQQLFGKNNGPSYLNAEDEPMMAPVDNSDIKGVEVKINSLQKTNRVDKGQFAKRVKTLEADLENIQLQKKQQNLKLREIEQKCRLKDHTIKNLKRMIRQEQLRKTGPQLNVQVDQSPERTKKQQIVASSVRNLQRYGKKSGKQDDVKMNKTIKEKKSGKQDDAKANKTIKEKKVRQEFANPALGQSVKIEKQSKFGKEQIAKKKNIFDTEIESSVFNVKGSVFDEPDNKIIDKHEDSLINIKDDPFMPKLSKLEDFQ